MTNNTLTNFPEAKIEAVVSTRFTIISMYGNYHIVENGVVVFDRDYESRREARHAICACGIHYEGERFCRYDTEQ